MTLESWISDRRPLGVEESTICREPFWVRAAWHVQHRDLANDHVRRARIRLRAVDILFEAESRADVVRESREVIERALNGLPRAHGVEPPRIHDISEVLLAERARSGAYRTVDAVPPHVSGAGGKR